MPMCRRRRPVALRWALPAILAIAGFSPAVEAQFTATHEYAAIGYDRVAHDNPVARVQHELKNGDLELEFRDTRGYFDALLDALDVDPASQMLVFSATSLQKDLISRATPRGLFFNDDTFVGLVQNSHIVEVVTIDGELGTVFYTFDNTEGTDKYFERADQTCLVCHDTQGTQGYGVPQLMALSSIYNVHDLPLLSVAGGGNVGDETPLSERWGGWYVTGRHGVQAHLGNLALDSADELESLDDHRVWNLETLKGAGYLDTSRYPRATSDIVALLLLEHQITVHNQITYIRFKAPGVLQRAGMADALTAPSWSALPEKARTTLRPMMDELVERLVLIDAADFASRISGSQEFLDGFLARGPRDGEGRSLRDLDLETRLFRYPLSYLIYSENFAALPAYAKDYVYRRLAAYLQGEERIDGKSQYTAAERGEALEILSATQPDFLPYLSSSRR